MQLKKYMTVALIYFGVREGLAFCFGQDRSASMTPPIWLAKNE